MKTFLMFFLLFLVLQEATTGYVCDEYNEYCIFADFSHGAVPHETAENNCKNYGGRLVNIDTTGKNDFIMRKISLSRVKPAEYWIGLTKKNESYWYKSDGSVVHIFDTFFTMLKEDRDKACAIVVQPEGVWHETKCSDKTVAICEVSTSPKRCEMSEISIKNAQFDKCGESTSVKLGFTVSVTCNQGFTLNGSKLVFCTESGWSEIPTCEPGCLAPELTSGVKIFNGKSKYKTGEEIMIYCEHGFLLGDMPLKNHQIVKCNFDGSWPSLKHYCITDPQLKCQDDICTKISTTAKLNQAISLKCSHDSYILWIKNHQPILTTDGDYSITQSELTIHQLTPDSVGIYSCVVGHNETNMEAITIYDVQLQKSCPQSTLQTLPSVNANEGDSIYLRSSGAGLNTAINWFKDGVRLTPNTNINILPNGDVLIKTATLLDEGLYKFQVQTESPSCFQDYSMNVYVKSTTETICGTSDNENDQPWLVTLMSLDETTPFCYGTLVNEYWIISSAFCLSRFNKQKTTNFIAQFQPYNNISTWDVPVAKIVVHPQYLERLNTNDIGLLKLKEPVNYSKFLKPVCLSSRDFQVEHDSICGKKPFLGSTSGWGSIEALETGHLGSKGTENLTVLSKEQCQKSNSKELLDKMFCVVHDENDKRPVKLVGDTGSPFLVRENGRFYIHGVLSLGERLAQVGKYDYYTKVAAYYDWIESNME